MPHDRTTAYAPVPVPVPVQAHAPAWTIPSDRADAYEAHRAWEAHVAAGRIGNNPPPSAQVLARRLAFDAQLVALSRGARGARG